MIDKLILRPDQETKVARILAEPTCSALLGDVMGKGKTLVGVEVILRGGFKRGLLVGVKDTYAQWAERIEAQSEGARELRRIDSTKAGQQAFADFLAGHDGLFFSGSEYLREQDFELIYKRDGNGRRFAKRKKSGDAITRKGRGTGPADYPVFDSLTNHTFRYKKMKPVDIILYDEVHVVANKKALGLRTLRTIKTDFKLGMSGTFYGNQFKGAWSICQWLWPELIDPSSIRWEDEWCAKKSVYIAGGVEKQLVSGEKEPGEFVKTLPCYIRDDDWERPPAPEEFYVDLSPKQREQYDDLERDLLVWIQKHPSVRSANDDLEALVADLPITLRVRLRQAALGEMSFDENGDIGFALDCQSSKLNAIAQIIDRPSWRDKQVAIYTESKKFAKVIVARLIRAGYSAREWSGDVSSKNRDEIKRAFLAGEFQYLVSVIAAFSTGLDGFQTVCSDLIWVSESEDGKMNDQALARYFRPGRVGEFRHIKILAKETHDVKVYSRLIAAGLGVQKTLRAA